MKLLIGLALILAAGLLALADWPLLSGVLIAAGVFIVLFASADALEPDDFDQTNLIRA